MARAGRKRKQGKRHPNGQLVRTPKIDRGTAELQMHRLARVSMVPGASLEIWMSHGAGAAIAGTMPSRSEMKRGAAPGVPAIQAVDVSESFDPIGRAWMAGLLDHVDGYDALDLRDVGRRFASLYWRKLPAPSPVSRLYAKMVSGLVDELPAGVDREQMIEDADARDERQEAALNRLLAGLRALGHDVKKATEQLTLDPFADTGPSWLDRLIAAKAAAQPALRKAMSRKLTIDAGKIIVDDELVFIDMRPGEEVRLLDARDWWRFGAMSVIGDAGVVMGKAIDGLKLLCRGGRLTDVRT